MPYHSSSTRPNTSRRNTSYRGNRSFGGGGSSQRRGPNLQLAADVRVLEIDVC